MSRREDAATPYGEALREAIEWANDLDAPLTRDDVTFAEVEAHAMEIDGATVLDRAVTDRSMS